MHYYYIVQQSFPFESVTQPLLWEGAYSTKERYSHDDILDVVEYGRARGVKVG